MAQSYRQKPDSELLLLIKDGDARAFEEAFARFWPLLHRFVSRMLRDTDAATDIVQDVFVVLWEKRSLLEAGGVFKAYLYAIAKNRVLKSVRKSKVEEAYLDHLEHHFEEGQPTTEQQIYLKELSERIEEGMEEMPPKVREAFELSRLEEMSYREIAAEMDISDQTVKHHIVSALRILRRKMPVLSFFSF